MSTNHKAQHTQQAVLGAGLGDTAPGLAGVQQGNTVTLLATNAGGLVKLTDTSGFLKSLSGTPTLLSSAKANTALRGVALAPLP